MKRTSRLLVFIAVLCAVAASAQDAATQERLDKLSGQIEDIIATQRAQQKHIEALSKEIESLREQVGKHSGNYASLEDIKRVADAVNDVERKRVEDSERISKELGKIRQAVTTPLPQGPKSSSTKPNSSEKPTEKGYKYTIQQGDTLAAIVQAYRDKNIKVSTDQILKANPGLKADKLKVGSEIWIPAP